MPFEAQRLQSTDHIATPKAMPHHARRLALHGLLLAICAALAGCSTFDGASKSLSGLIRPYQIDIVQGNFVSSEQVALLKNGMARQSVRELLGTPLLQSLFHADRWDYVFSFKRTGEDAQMRKVTVFFKDGMLEKFEADTLPTEAEFVASLSSGRKATKVPVLEASEEALKQFPAAAKTPEPKVLPPLPSTYPPLEPASP